MDGKSPVRKDIVIKFFNNFL